MYAVMILNKTNDGTHQLPQKITVFSRAHHQYRPSDRDVLYIAPRNPFAVIHVKLSH